MATQKEMREKSRTQVFRTLANVVRTVSITPRMRRITLGGEGLQPLFEGERLPADAIKLYLPRPGQAGFMPEFGILPTPDNEFYIRAYTIRRFNRDAHELDIDIVLHGDSPGSVWARTVKPGDQVGFVGPRHDYLAPDNTDWYLFAGDETAQPAICAIVESLPGTARAFIFLEVTDELDEVPIHTDADIKVTWLHRDDVHAGKSDLLEQAIRHLEWPDGKPFIWVAGETGVVRGIRSYLRHEHEVAKEHVHISGYWRYGMNNTQFDQQTVREYQAALDAGKLIDDHHDVDQVENDAQ